MSEPAAILCAFCILLVPCCHAGLALMNTGLVRSRSAAHVMTASMCAVSVAALAYFVCGFSWQGFSGRAAHEFSAAGRVWNWLASEPWFLSGIEWNGSPASLAACLQMLSVGLVAIIPIGAGTDRWRLSATCASSALVGAWTYPLFAHWTWGGGWLTQAGFMDVAGSGTIQAVGGLTALSIAWILGPRRGKYTLEGMPAAIPGHSAVLVVFAALLALIGWLALNTAGAILFGTAPIGRVPLVAVNTILCAGSAAVTGAAITRVRFARPDASLTANAWIGGLAASSATCSFAPPVGAVLIGAVTGAIVVFGVEWLELHCGIDDPGGAIAVHAGGGLWGVLAAAIFNGHWVGQLAGTATLLGFVLPLTYGLNLLLDRVHHQRVAPEGERQGMDLYELGAGAYPEFLTHGEDFFSRP